MVRKIGPGRDIHGTDATQRIKGEYRNILYEDDFLAGGLERGDSGRKSKAEISATFCDCR